MKEIAKVNENKHALNIVSLTYLDPRRYYKYFYIWSFLGVLGFFQWLQYFWIKKKSNKWRSFMEIWQNNMKELIKGDNFSWYPFKEDYLPHSVVKFFFLFNIGFFVERIFKE
jgi:hypothetical protein